MQSGSLSYRPSHAFSRDTRSSRRLPSSLNHRTNFFLLPPKSLRLHATHEQPCTFPRNPGLSTPTSAFTTTSRILGIPKDGRGRRFTKVEATSVPESADGGSDLPSVQSSSRIEETLILGFLFGLWYLFNIYFNIYNKQVLKVYPHPITMTTFQMAIGVSLIVFMWTTGLHKKPKFNSSQLLRILPLAIIHTAANLFTNLSLGKVAVSFTHTIKALEPFFTVILSMVFLGELPSSRVVASLAPIVGGVILASMTEASFNWVGFWSAMASNLANQSRNVLSKKVMIHNEDYLDNISLFSIITIMSFLLMVPIAMLTEGIKFTPAYLHSMGLNVREVCTRVLLAGICLHSYQQISYMILERVSPVTHSVGNCVKRVVVIVSSVLFFKTPVSLINSLGTGLAMVGVFLYSRVKRIKSKPEVKAA